MTRTCSFDGCNEPHKAKGWCNTHYLRALYNDGDPSRPEVILTCPGCGEAFTRKAHNGIYCSRRCSNRLRNRKRYAENPQAFWEWNKKWRAENRERRNAKERERYATDPVRYSRRDVRRAWEQANPDKVKRSDRKRMARLRQIPFEDFTDLEIFERDRWICQLCRKPVDRRKAFPDRGAATIDHIIPVSVEGSSHTRANVQLAHFACNAGKQNRPVSEQLRLIG